MTSMTPRALVLCAAGVLVALALGVAQLARAGGGDDRAPPAGTAIAPISIDDGASGERVVVHVAGAVRRPGVYRMRAGDRVDDAVRRAGGATRRADLGGLNLAAKVEDGRQVLVPLRAPRQVAGAPPAAAPGAASAAPAQPVNVNTATLEQLDTLSGIGPATAQKIIDYRAEHGGFATVEELGQVPGIGDVRLASLREEVTL
jgi:competence protein ComEA